MRRDQEIEREMLMENRKEEEEEEEEGIFIPRKELIQFLQKKKRKANYIKKATIANKTQRVDIALGAAYPCQLTRSIKA